MTRVPVLKLAHAQDLPLPSYQSEHAAGADLCAAVSADAPVVLEPGQRAAIPTGIALALPLGTEAQVRPRSGFALRYGVTVLNAPGTIDSDYRGEIQVLLVNLGHSPVRIERGMRIAQLVVAPVRRAEFAITDDLSTSARGGSGFGSTGLHSSETRFEENQ